MPAAPERPANLVMPASLERPPNLAQVLTGFDTFKTAGVKNKAVIEPFAENAEASGRSVIQFTPVIDGSLISGIEIQ
jgi:hypothetical protein